MSHKDEDHMIVWNYLIIYLYPPFVLKKKKWRNLSSSWIPKEDFVLDFCGLEYCVTIILKFKSLILIIYMVW